MVVEGEVEMGQMGIRLGREIWGWGWGGRVLVRGMILVRRVGDWIYLRGSFLGGRAIFKVGIQDWARGKWKTIRKRERHFEDNGK